MSLERVRDTWTALGERNAFWAVLTGPAGASREWDPDAFFETGEEEIEWLMTELTALDAVPQPGAALDFGCGAGRLTRALGRRFDRAVGVDISAPMIQLAEKLNQGEESCVFVHNERADLAVLSDASFDLVYSSITLQHMPPALSSGYLREFFRLVRSGGSIVFQIPAAYVAQPLPRTVAQAPLPRKAFAAAITVNSSGIRCAPQAELPVIARVKNIGNALWPAGSRDDARFSIRLGNHWRSWRLPWSIRFDDVRAQLPHDLGPGEETEVGIRVVAPPAAGRYRLELDMVQEHVSWFAKRGSKKATVPVEVDPAMPPGTATGLPPRMEMHGMPREEVEALIEGEGGEIIAVHPDDSPGPDWTSFRYFARKR